MLSVLKDNYEVIEDLAYCQTKLVDDKQEGFPPIIMETIFDMTDKGKLKELKNSYTPFYPSFSRPQGRLFSCPKHGTPALFSRNRRLGHGKNDNMQEGRTLDECFNPFVQVNSSNRIYFFKNIKNFFSIYNFTMTICLFNQNR